MRMVVGGRVVGAQIHDVRIAALCLAYESASCGRTIATSDVFRDSVFATRSPDAARDLSIVAETRRADCDLQIGNVTRLMSTSRSRER